MLFFAIYPVARSLLIRSAEDHIALVSLFLQRNKPTFLSASNFPSRKVA